jgi:gas vesicle protein
MGNISLLQHEHEVERSRAKLTQDLAVLCSPATLAAFTDDLKQEAFETRDAFWEKIKARAASNPAAVMAIGAGLAWRLLRSPPIASALIGVGLFSLWKTQPRTAYDASGRRLDYTEQSKEVLKQQAGQVFAAAADIAGKAQEVAAAKGSEVWEGAKETMRMWQGEMGDSVAETTSKLKTSGEALLNDIRAKRQDLRDEIQEAATAVRDKVRDDDTRNTLLLGVAGVAIAGALGIACQKKISETLAD